MFKATCILCCGILICAKIQVISAKYEPNWNSLDKRPLPPWYDEGKIGIFLHWGVFSVPSLSSEWFWHQWNESRSEEINNYIKNNFPPGWTYQEFARDFTAELWNATQWAELFAKSGAKYVVLTSKHHEGYTLWPSKYSFSWNAKDVGPHRDLVGELAEAVRAANLKFGLYHSLYEWFNPIYLDDKASGYEKQNFVNNKVLPEMYELINAYKPSVLWSDGDWEASDTYWKSTEFLAWLYNESPVKDEIVANDRWGQGMSCHHGGFYTCADRYDPGTLQEKKWENAMTIDKEAWAFRRNAKLEDFLTEAELLTTLVRTISCGGNLLINVGPTKDGIIAPIFEERLTQLGKWLDINGEAIYESQPWTAQNDSVNGNVWYTTRDTALYAMDLEWPKDNIVVLGSVGDIFKNADTAVTLLGNNGNLQWLLNDNTQVEIQLPDKSTVKSATVWVLKITSPTL